MKTIVIKITGELLLCSSSFTPNKILKSIASQIKSLQKKYNIVLVLGGGNIFRGNQHGKEFELKETTAHYSGMIATIINGLIFKDVFEANNIPCTLFSAITCQKIACVIKQENINKSLSEKKCLIFVGGTGNPFFTTDTNAMLRALQTNAIEIWKGTKVNGIYSDDPTKNENSEFIQNISYDDFIKKDLKVMDLTAITLAKQHRLKIRIFNIFEENSLLLADKNKNFGSTIS